MRCTPQMKIIPLFFVQPLFYITIFCNCLNNLNKKHMWRTYFKLMKWIKIKCLKVFLHLMIAFFQIMTMFLWRQCPQWGLSKWLIWSIASPSTACRCRRPQKTCFLHYTVRCSNTETVARRTRKNHETPDTWVTGRSYKYKCM